MFMRFPPRGLCSAAMLPRVPWARARIAGPSCPQLPGVARARRRHSAATDCDSSSDFRSHTNGRGYTVELRLAGHGARREAYRTMIFAKRSRPPEGPVDSAQTHYSSQLAGEGLEREYEDIVRAQVARLGVPLETVEVEVRPAG